MAKKTVKVKASVRKGHVVKAHTRKIDAPLPGTSPGGAFQKVLRQAHEPVTPDEFEQWFEWDDHKPSDEKYLESLALRIKNMIGPDSYDKLESKWDRTDLDAKTFYTKVFLKMPKSEGAGFANRNLQAVKTNYHHNVLSDAKNGIEERMQFERRVNYVSEFEKKKHLIGDPKANFEQVAKRVRPSELLDPVTGKPIKPKKR